MKIFLFAALLPLAALAAEPPLADYVGTYRAGPAQSAELVVGSGLTAVIGESKYRLRSLGGDNFANPGGRTIPFHRDATGAIADFVDDQTVYRRVSTDVRRETLDLLRPRANKDYRYQVPPARDDGIAVGDLRDSGIGLIAAEKIVRGILDESWPEVHGVLLYQHGKLVMEEYFYGYDIDRTHQMRSATKSIVSALAGIAIDRNALPGSGQPALPYLAYAAYDNPDPRKSRITLGDLLAMRSGLACNDYDSNSPGNEQLIDETPDWVKATMDLPMVADPGALARYCSGGVAVIGRITENRTGMTLPAFAREYLFGPLGIQPSQWRWNYTLTNENKEYSQIHLRPRDMLKIGVMYADGGRWQGRQVISSSWVRESLSRQSQIDGTNYGYFWWLQRFDVDTPNGKRAVQVSAAQGNGGQKIFIVPEFDMVAVFTGGGYNAGSTPPNKIMTSILLPALISASAKAASR